MIIGVQQVTRVHTIPPFGNNHKLHDKHQHIFIVYVAFKKPSINGLLQPGPF